MADIFKLKRRASNGAAGAPSALKSGEPAYNMADGYIYIGYGDDGSGNATTVKPIAKDDFNIGQRVPTGGATGQVLTKTSNADYATGWAAAASPYSAGSGILINGSNVISADTSVLATLAGTNAWSGANSFSASPTVPTATAGDSTTKAASTAFVSTALQNYTTTTTLQNTYAPLASPSLTGAPTAPTQAAGDSSTKLATTLYADRAVSNGLVGYATTAYVDTSIQGLKPKGARFAFTANVSTLSGLQNGDGITGAPNDVVFLPFQTTASQNGLWIMQSGSWTRPPNFNSAAMVPGSYVLIDLGAVYGGHGFIITNDPDAAFTFGTTAITVQEFTGAGDIIAGNGITKGGNTLSVTAGTGIQVTGAGVGLTGNALAYFNLAGAADAVPYYTGASALSTFTMTSFSRGLAVNTTAASWRSGLGLASMATQDAGAVAITGGTIDGVTLDGGTF